MAEPVNAYPKPGQKLDDHPIAQIMPMMNAVDKDELRESIKKNGQREDIVLLDGMILDGRNRYECCVDLGREPRFRFYDYVKDGASPTSFVLDKNLRRRHLTPSQAATIAVEALPFFEAEAKIRQRKTGIAQTENLRNRNRPSDDTDQRTEHEEEPVVATSSPAPITPPAPPPAQPVEQELPLPTGTAAAHAAQLVGVSERLVQDAKTIQQTNPEAFEAIKAGDATVNSVRQETAEEKKKKQELEDAYGRISQVCGASLGAAVREGTRLKGRREVIAYAKLSDDDMLRIRGLIEDGWPVKKAVAYKMVGLCRTHRISDLIARAAAQSGTLTLTIEGWVIDVKREGVNGTA